MPSLVKLAMCVFPSVIASGSDFPHPADLSAAAIPRVMAPERKSDVGRCMVTLTPKRKLEQMSSLQN